MAEEESLRLNGIDIKKLLNKDFVGKLEELKEDIVPISIIIVKAKDSMPTPLIIGHQNKKEVDDKILHIGSPDSNFLNKVKEIIEHL